MKLFSSPKLINLFFSPQILQAWSYKSKTLSRFLSDFELFYAFNHISNAKMIIGTGFLFDDYKGR
jgi:hypothetical protein